MSFVIGGPTSKWIKTASKSADYTILDTDELGIIYVPDTSTDRTITLPTASDNTDRVILIKNTSTDKGKVTVDGEGTETIDGFTTMDLDFKNSFIEMQCDGSNWQIINTNLTSVMKEYDISSSTSATGWTTTSSEAIPYRSLDGTWRMRFNTIMTVTTAVNISSLYTTITGVTFANKSYGQSITGTAQQGSTVRGVKGTYARANYGEIRITLDAAQDCNEISYSGDVELESKPTFVE